MKKIIYIAIVISLFVFSCKNREENALQELEKRGVEFSEKSFFEQIEKVDTETVKLFIEAKADVDAENHKKQTPLMIASIYNLTEIAKMLINSGANINARDKSGKTALHHSIVNGTEIFHMLVSNGADLDKKDNKEETPLHYVARFKRKEMFNRLMVENIQLDTSNKNGFTPLAISIYSKEYKMAKTLIEKGADVKKANSEGVAPLMLAASGGRSSQPELVKLILEKGAEIDSVDFEGKTALFYAVGKIWIDITKILLEAGANPKVVDKTGKTVFDLLTGEGLKEDRQKIRDIINSKINEKITFES
ncbi:MAG: ankyrin repeat domain-containing protein [bacterium]